METGLRILRARCPTCRRQFLWQEGPSRPFCSITCRLIDLGRWLDEGYRIAGEEALTNPPDDRVQHGAG